MWKRKDDEHDYNLGYYDGQKNYPQRYLNAPYYDKGRDAGQRRLTANGSGPIVHVAASQGAAHQIAMELKL